MKLSKVEIKNDEYTKVFVNGIELKHVKAVKFEQNCDIIPTFTIEIIGMPDIEVMGAANLIVTPTTLDEALQVLNKYIDRSELKTGAQSPSSTT